jgi:hypothetical protein
LFRFFGFKRFHNKILGERERRTQRKLDDIKTRRTRREGQEEKPEKQTLESFSNFLISSVFAASTAVLPCVRGTERRETKRKTVSSRAGEGMGGRRDQPLCF